MVNPTRSIGAATTFASVRCLLKATYIVFAKCARSASSALHLKSVKKETEVLRSERNFDANERIKLTLRVAYKLFELQPAPNFGGSEWHRAQRVLKKRHLLMHPKSSTDLQISDDLWDELYGDITWLIEQLFNFMSALEKKHGC